jgi:hypothetical protein
MVFKTILILMVFAVLLEDSASIRKTEEERKEDEELAERVNATLAAEEAEKKKEEDEKKKRDQEKIKKEKEKRKQDKSVGKQVDQEEVQDEAGPSLNCSCPTVESCEPCEDCPVANCSGQCKACPDVKPCKDCPVCKECGICPEVQPCKPCGPSPVANITVQPPSISGCPEAGEASMTIPVAMAVGAAATLLLTGVATAVGLVIRYVPPTVSGFLFVATIVMIWYLSSHHPDTVRELGGRVVEVLREATTTLSHRIVAAIRHHDQVSFLVLILSILLSDLSPIFQFLEKFALRFST